MIACGNVVPSLSFDNTNLLSQVVAFLSPLLAQGGYAPVLVPDKCHGPVSTCPILALPLRLEVRYKIQTCVSRVHSCN